MEEEEQELDVLEEEPPKVVEHPEVAALRKKNAELLSEVKESRKRERLSFLSEYPTLSEEDIKGFNPGQLRELAKKLVGSVQAPAASETPSEQPPEVEEGKKFASFDVGGAKPAAKEQLSALEAHKKYESKEWSDGEYANWRRQTYGQ